MLLDFVLRRAGFTGGLGTVIWLCLVVGSDQAARAADEFDRATAVISELCMDCHTGANAKAKVDLAVLVARPDVAGNFRIWQKVAAMLASGKMPPTGALQPDELEREQVVRAIRHRLRTVAELHQDDPGPVVIRRLTGAEYGYTIRDLTGLDLRIERDFVSDAVGGEGFANLGTVQFMQDSTLERYLAAAKQIADHAVVGAGRLAFFEDPGKTGFELSAITRIQQIYRDHGFRTGAGEGGEAFGLDRYPRAFFVAWQYRYRSELGIEEKSLGALAAQEGIDRRFAQYIWMVLNQANPSFPTSDVVERWQSLEAPDKPSQQKVFRAKCKQVHQVMMDWQNRFGQNADAKEEAPVLAVDRFDVARTKLLDMNVNWPKGTAVAHLRIKVESASDQQRPKVLVVWKNPQIQFRVPDRRLRDPRPLESVLSKEDRVELKFGRHPARREVISNSFVTQGTGLTRFELPIAPGATSARLTVEAELDVIDGDDCIVRCTIAQEEETDQGKQVSALLVNPGSATFQQWKEGVLEFARQLPQVSHREPAPSDRDPIPAPFDNSYNNPERNHYHYKIKYYRDDQFFVDNIIDDQTRVELDVAWMDLLGSFEYHDSYLRFVAEKYQLKLDDRGIADLEPGWIERLPPRPKKYLIRLRKSHQSIQKAFRAAEPGHLRDALRFAGMAWRRPLSGAAEAGLRRFYQRLRTEEKLDHSKAIRALLARVLMAPDFLYRAESARSVASESTQATTPVIALSDWEMASRLSYFLWSSTPDQQLRRAAAAGELTSPEKLAEQAVRMLRDPKAQRFATEFFGQWFGFYRFDDYRGVDPKRFPEFTDEVKSAMYREAITFFEHLVRSDRPVGETLFADYTFLNRTLAAHYGVSGEFPADNRMIRTNVRSGHRGGLLSLGAVLTVTSAPLRTSPVKRGDWILRRVLGTPVPPPPPDAGSIAADDAISDGLTIRTRLEAHRRDHSCRNCHSRIDPLGFALEQFDPVGRWRKRYRDGQKIETSGTLRDGTEIGGVEDLRAYLQARQSLFFRTLCTKLVGYAFGRSESICDQALIDRMLASRENARFSRLVKQIVTSRQFRFVRTGAPSNADTN